MSSSEQRDIKSILLIFSDTYLFWCSALSTYIQTIPRIGWKLRKNDDRIYPRLLTSYQK